MPTATPPSARSVNSDATERSDWRSPGTPSANLQRVLRPLLLNKYEARLAELGVRTVGDLQVLGDSLVPFLQDEVGLTLVEAARLANAVAPPRRRALLVALVLVALALVPAAITAITGAPAEPARTVIHPRRLSTMLPLATLATLRWCSRGTNDLAVKLACPFRVGFDSG